MSKKKAVVIGAGVNGLVLSNYLQKNNYDVHLFSWDKKNSKSFYQISKKVYSIRLTNDLGYKLIYPRIDKFLNSLLKK